MNYFPKIMVALFVIFALSFSACLRKPEDDASPPRDIQSISLIPLDSSVDIVWLPQPDKDFDHMEIVCKPEAVETTVSLRSEQGALHHQVYGLTNGQVYEFTVRGVDHYKNKTNPFIVYGTPQAPVTEAPFEVTGASAYAGDGKITLLWSDPSDESFLGIKISRDGVDTVDVAKGVQGYVVESLTNGVCYSMRIYGEYSSGGSTYYSNGVTVYAIPTKLDYLPPAKPVVTLSQLSDTSVQINWTEPSDSDFCGVEITYAPEATTATPFNVYKGTTSATIEGLVVGTSYAISVRSFDTSSNFSAEVLKSITPGDITAPAQPECVFSTPSFGRVSIEWSVSDPSDTEGVTVSYYDILSASDKTITATSSPVTIDDLAFGKTHSFAVSSFDAAGNSSDPVTCPVTVTPGENLVCHASAGASDADRFGTSVAVSSTHGFVGAPWKDGCGTVSVYEYTYGFWFECGDLTLSGNTDDMIGTAVAMSGIYAAVSMPGWDGVAADSGKVVFFEYDGSTWSQNSSDVSSSSAGEYFGSSLSMDGTNCLVGAKQPDGAGAAYVFSRDASALWSQSDVLSSPLSAAGGLFGSSGDILGECVIIGAPGENSSAGNAYLFSGSPWSSNRQTLDTAGISAGYAFGTSVAVTCTSDGNYFAFVGAPNCTLSGSGNAGAVFIYKYDSTSETWVRYANGISVGGRTDILPVSSAAGDHFGLSVAAEGDFVVSGLVNDTGKGSAYVFKYISSTGQWVARQQLFGSVLAGADPNDNFGCSVGISDTDIYVGAVKDYLDSSFIDAGGVYIYR